MQKLKNQVRRKVLLTSLGVTKIVADSDITIPGRWRAFYDTLRVSSDVAHTRISVMDRNVEKDFQEIERRLGKGKMYDEREIKELKDKIEEIEVKQA